jgi:hypothetical protein
VNFRLRLSNPAKSLAPVFLGLSLLASPGLLGLTAVFLAAAPQAPAIADDKDSGKLLDILSDTAKDKSVQSGGAADSGSGFNMGDISSMLGSTNPGEMKELMKEMVSLIKEDPSILKSFIGMGAEMLPVEGRTKDVAKDLSKSGTLDMVFDMLSRFRK